MSVDYTALEYNFIFKVRINEYIMVTLKKLKADLTVTPKDLERAVTPKLRNLMQITPNAGFSIPSDYAFQCVCCESIGMDPYYQLLKESVGPYSRRTDTSRLKSTKGIVPLKDLESEPEFSSHLNFTRVGLVCDHCADTVYSKN